jgi:branched-chain amino acid transport system ATP-binding protein
MSMVLKEPVLQIVRLTAGYHGSTVLHEVSLDCEEGLTLVVGPNGAGKSTLVKAITGLLRPVQGKVIFMGREIQGLSAEQIAKLGISLVPERGRLFYEMNVRDNLEIGFRLRTKRGERVDFKNALDDVLALLPELSDKLDKVASKLSGGEQQMVAIARALLSRPSFLVMDEPTTGLYPSLVKRLVSKIGEISKDLSMLITEQNVTQIAPVTDRVYLLESGMIALSGEPDKILADDRVRLLYLGGR